MKVTYSAHTDTGRQRTRNEDSVLAYPVLEGGLHLFAVADGIGSLETGAESSRIAVETLAGAFRHGAGADPGASLMAAVRQANAVLFAEGEAGTRGRMGSTVVALLLHRGGCEVAHVGDSRAYRLRDGVLQQLTEDHSFVAEQVRAGHLTEAQARASRHRHIITRSLGAAAEVQIDHRGWEPVQQGDIFLLSSDGLHDVVADDEMAAVLRDHAPETAARTLIDMANARGGPDNISVIAVRVDRADDAREL